MNPNDFVGRIRPQPLSKSKIIEKARRLSDKYFRVCGLPTPLMAISFDAVYEQVIYPDYGISLEESEDLGYDDRGEKILGKFDPIANTAFIDVSLHAKDPRRPFTCWHEVGGHGVLQGDWLRRQMMKHRQPSSVVTTAASLDLETTSILEWQANLFAASAAAPRKLLYFAIDDVLNLTRKIRYVGPSDYTLSIRGTIRRYSVSSLNDLCRVIGQHIKWRFGNLSIEALSYQIERLPIFDDMTVPKIFLHRVVPQITAYTPMANC